MEASTEAVADSAVSSGPTLGDFIADALGDPSGYETTESPSSADSDAAGAPPAERQSAPDAQSSPSEGTTPDARAGAPPADATAVTPDAVPAVAAPPGAAEPTPDPLASATPFTYTVNGQERPFDGIRVLGEHGAIISAEALPMVQQRLSERDNLYERARESYNLTQQYERLASWTTTGADGKEVVTPGLQGLVQMRVELVRSRAENAVLNGLLDDPDTLVSMLRTGEDGKVFIDPKELQLLAYRARDNQNQSEQTVRDVLGRLVTHAPPSPTAAPAAQAPDLRQHAPTIINGAAGANASKLSESDKQFLTEQLPRYVRAVNHEDRLTNPALTLGGPIVDYQFTRVVQDRVALRNEMAATAAATAAASSENAKKLAQAALGNRPAVQPPRVEAPPVAKPPANQRASDQSDAWDLMEKLQSGRAF